MNVHIVFTSFNRQFDGSISFDFYVYTVRFLRSFNEIDAIRLNNEIKPRGHVQRDLILIIFSASVLSWRQSDFHNTHTHKSRKCRYKQHTTRSSKNTKANLRHHATASSTSFEGVRRFAIAAVTKLVWKNGRRHSVTLPILV